MYQYHIFYQNLSDSPVTIKANKGLLEMNNYYIIYYLKIIIP